MKSLGLYSFGKNVEPDVASQRNVDVSFETPKMKPKQTPLICGPGEKPSHLLSRTARLNHMLSVYAALDEQVQVEVTFPQNLWPQVAVFHDK